MNFVVICKEISRKAISAFLAMTLSLGTFSIAAKSGASENYIGDTVVFAEETLGFGKRLTPVMGWASWNALGHNISDESLMAQMDALVSTGLANAGYVYFNIDDTYQNGRDGVTGRLKVNETKFPYGMKKYADEAHKRGLYAGIYSDGGDNSCASGNDEVNKPWGIGVGLLGHERDDLYMFLGDGIYEDTYARENQDDGGIECWGYDFLKVDWCGGAHAGLNDEEQYTKIGDIISEIEETFGKDKIYNICRWAYSGPWQLKADSWRIGADIDMSGKSFDSVMVQVDKMKNLSYLTGPGHVNDPDMMVVGKGLTEEEDKTHFALWCMFSAPLMIGCDLTALSESTLALLKNEELIAINQDPACLSATYLGDIGTNVEVWLKPLGSADSDTKAIAFVNRSKIPQTVSYDFSDIGYSGKVNIRDLFTHGDLSADTGVSITLGSHETAIYKLSPTEKAPEITLSSSLSQVTENVLFEGVEGVDYSIFGAASEGSEIAVESVGEVSEYTPSVSYNGISKGVSVGGDGAALTVSFPCRLSESTATIYFGGDSGSAEIIASIGGKSICKAVELDGGTKAYSVKFYSSSPEDSFSFTLKGDIFADAVSIVTDVTSSGSAALSESLPTTYNLTEKGTSDWLFYGESGSFRGVRKKDGGSQISVRTGGGEKLTSSGTGVTYKWSDGDIQTAASSARGGCCAYGEGYSILFPSDGTQRHIELPFGIYSADAEIEFSVGGTVILSESVTGTESSMTKRFFTADYSSDGKTSATLRIKPINAYTSNAFAIIEGIALSAEGEGFVHSSVGANIEGYNPETGAYDWVKFGTSPSRKDGANLISDYITTGAVTPSATENGVFIGDYSGGIELPLPSSTGLSRADICFEVKNAVAGVNVYTNGKKTYTAVSDIDGGKNTVVSVWYDSGVRAGVSITLKGKIAGDGGITLKSASYYGSIGAVADYPTLVEENGTVTASLLARAESGSKNAGLVIDLYGDSGLISSESTPCVLTAELSEISAPIALPEDFDKGIIKTYVTDEEGSLLGRISSCKYPLSESVSTADVENRIGGLTAKYLVETKNALLLDVRSAAEYAEGHIEGAINIEYTSIIDEVEALIPDKDTVIIAYCSSAKRSAQAVLTLTAMGYKNAYNLGEMSAYDVVPEISLPDPNTGVKWAAGGIIYASCPEISRYDRVRVMYSVGEESTLADALPYDASSGIGITDSGTGAFTVKAYLVLSESGEVIAETSETYTLAMDIAAIDVFLSDIEYTLSGKLTNYVKADTSVDGKVININGTEYTKGIGMNAGPETGYSTLTAAIPSYAEYFTAVVGRDRDITWSKAQTAVFRVSIDGVLVASSPEIGWEDEYVFRIAIPENAEEISISVIGDSNGNHCAWGNAGFIIDPTHNIPDVSKLNVTAYLSELSYTSNETRYINNDLSVDGSALSVAGTVYEKGIGINAGSSTYGGTIECDIPLGANRFVAVAGHSSSAKATAASAVYSVYFDDVLAEVSPAMTKGDFYVFRTEIPRDAEKIKLTVITTNRDTNHCAWAIAAFTSPRHGYVSDSGSDDNDELTPETPKKTISAASTVCDSDGAVKIVGTYTTKSREILSSQNVVLRIEGYDEGSKLLSYRASLGSEVELRDITVGRVDGAEVPLRINGHNLTIGKNVIFDGTYDVDGTTATKSFTLAQNDYTASPDLDNTVTLKSGVYGNVYVGNNYGNASGSVSLNIEDGVGTIGTVALNHSSNPKSVFSGNATVNINGGTINRIVIGSASRGGSDGTQHFVINGGTIGELYTTSIRGGNYSGDYSHEAVLQTGVNILEINGGTFKQKTVKRGELDSEAARVVIFNNGTGEGFTVSDSKAIVVMSNSSGRVTAKTDSLNNLTGFDVATSYERISAGGRLYTEFTTDSEGVKHFAIPAPESGASVTIGYGFAELRFNLNGAVGQAPENISCSEGELVSLPKEVDAANGTKIFAGWSEAPDGSKTLPVYVMGANDVTLYAVWKDSYDESYFGNFYSALMSGKATVGYLGGSITFGDGLSKYGADTRNALWWRGLTRDWFAKSFGASITEVNAAINGTGTRFASYRASEHLNLSSTPPDLLFIEFAINDAYEGYGEEEIRENLKIVIKKVLDANPYANFMFILTTDSNKLANDFPTLTYHRRFAEDFGIPYIDVGKAVVAEINAKGAGWNDYFSDWVHPDKKGNEVYAKDITDYFTAEFAGKTLDSSSKTVQSFEGIDESVDTDRHMSYISSRNDVNREKRVNFTDAFDSLGTTDGGSRFAFSFTGTNALIWSNKCRFNAEVDIYVDGSHTATSVLDTWRDDNYTQNYLFPVSEVDLEYGTHTVVGILRPVFKSYKDGFDSEGRRFNMRAIAVKGGKNEIPDFTFTDMPKTAVFINPYSESERTYYTGYGADYALETASVNLDYTTYIYEEGDVITLPEVLPEKEGESFLHWSETVGGSAVSAEDLVMSGEGKTFYAVFGKAEGVTVSGSFIKAESNPVIIRSEATDGFDYTSAARVTLFDASTGSVLDVFTEPQGGTSSVIEYSFDNVVCDSVYITIEKNGYVKYTSEVKNTAQGNVDLGSIYLITGDIKGSLDDYCGDGTVDAYDFIRIIRAFDSGAAQALRSAADIDEDGYVTIADLSLVKIGIGKGYGNN